MSANDVLSTNVHFEDWSNARAAALEANGVNKFEYFCVDQFLKAYPIADEDILAGITGGPNDGGVDAIFFFANRKVVNDETQISSDTTLRVNLAIFQVKENQGFGPNEINKMYFFTDDLLNLTISAATFQAKYNPRLLDIMDTFKTKFPKVGPHAQIFIDYYYISKVDEDTLNPAAQEAVNKLIAKAKEHLSAATLTFHPIGAPRLWAQIQQRPPKNRQLQFTELMETPEGRVGLVKLRDFFNFLRGDNGEIFERIFDSNVRGFQQETTVNVSIRETLTEPGQAEFWLLNNGITILASTVSSAGFKNVMIEDPQIVNGLQTSREVFAYYHALSTIPESDNRRVLVRVIQTTNSAVREGIVRATNNQNKMQPAALRATDLVHGHIETLFRSSGLYYDRRPGHHKDEGRPIDKIVSIVGLLQTMIAIVLQKPQDAYGAPGRYIREDNDYLSVFGENVHPVPLFLNCIKVQRKVDDFLAESDVERGHRQRLRFYVAMYATCVALKKSRPTKEEILQLDVAQVTNKMIDDSYKRVWKTYSKCGGDNLAAKGPKILQSLQRG